MYISSSNNSLLYFDVSAEIGMNIARLNFSHGSHEYHGQTIVNIREAVKKFQEDYGYDPCVAIALDTKGPEIRTGLLEGDDGRKEVILVKGDPIKITTDDEYKLKCTEKVLWVDYKNITKVNHVMQKLQMISVFHLCLAQFNVLLCYATQEFYNILPNVDLDKIMNNVN